MLEGETGTAYQRFHSDGLYHGANGVVLDFDEIADIGYVLVYEPGNVAHESAYTLTVTLRDTDPGRSRKAFKSIARSAVTGVIGTLGEHGVLVTGFDVAEVVR